MSTPTPEVEDTTETLKKLKDELVKLAEQIQNENKKKDSPEKTKALAKLEQQNKDLSIKVEAAKKEQSDREENEKKANSNKTKDPDKKPGPSSSSDKASTAKNTAGLTDAVAACKSNADKSAAAHLMDIVNLYQEIGKNLITNPANKLKSKAKSKLKKGLNAAKEGLKATAAAAVKQATGMAQQFQNAVSPEIAKNKAKLESKTKKKNETLVTEAKAKFEEANPTPEAKKAASNASMQSPLNMKPQPNTQDPVNMTEKTTDEVTRLSYTFKTEKPNVPNKEQEFNKSSSNNGSRNP